MVFGVKIAGIFVWARKMIVVIMIDVVLYCFYRLWITNCKN